MRRVAKYSANFVPCLTHLRSPISVRAAIRNVRIFNFTFIRKGIGILGWESKRVSAGSSIIPASDAQILVEEAKRPNISQFCITFSITQSNGAVRMPLQAWSAQCSVFCPTRLLTGYMVQTTTPFLIVARCSKQFTSNFGTKSHVSTKQ